MRRNSIFAKVFMVFWNTLDGARKIMHLLLLSAFFLILMAGLAPKVYKVPQGAALVLAPAGALVEQIEGDPLDRALEEATGGASVQTQMRDLVTAIKRAKEDSRIEAIVLDLDGMGGAGLSKLEELGQLIDDFKTSGKPVLAMASAYGKESYYLAAHADNVYLHPMGMVILDGYARYRMFYKDALDKLSIDWNVFRAGAYKSYAEPFMRNDMSDEDRASSKQWLDSLWASYRQGVVDARGISMEELDGYVNDYVPRLKAVQGDTAKVALQGKLVDGLMSRIEFSDHMKEIVGVDEEDETFKQIHFLDYLDALNGTEKVGHGKDQVAVIVASGNIVGGEQPPGTIGSDSTSRLIRRAAEDEKVKAVVLRVDSGGGSALASEFIREELLRLKETGKPLVVSMGSVAASGGYWIAMSADEIWASPNTITGSIGVVAMFPTIPRSLKRLGLNVDGVGTAPLSGDFRIDRPLSDDVKAIVQAIVDSGYQDFITKVANARGLEVSEVDRVGQGRVWIGATAHEIGLVDQLGGLQDAVKSAAAMAGMDDYRVRYIEQELDPADKLLISMLKDAGILGRVQQRTAAWSALGVDGVLDMLKLELESLSQFNDPRGVYMHCFCGDQ